MALQPSDLLVIHRPGPGNGTLYNCPVKDFLIDTTLATEEIAGIVRLATVEEVIEGRNNQLAISPYNLAEAFASPLYVFDGNSVTGDDDYDTTPNVSAFAVEPAADTPNATEESTGVVRLATPAETIVGTANDIAITPAGLRALLNEPTYVFDVGAIKIDDNNYDYIEA